MHRKPFRASFAGMERTHLQILGGNSRSRAEQARIAFALGHHAEIYATVDELIERPPAEGVLLAADGEMEGGVPALLALLGKAGIWLPLVVTAEEWAIDQVVDAIRAGAVDYLALPLEMSSFAGRLRRILAEAGPQIERRRRELEARRQIATLSPREREVLEFLAAGQTNKLIARDLGISPRTVEIHRANMMGKLGAGHPADAVRLWMDAGFAPVLDRREQLAPAGPALVPHIGRRTAVRDREAA